MAELAPVPAEIVTLRPPPGKDRSQRQLWSPATQQLRQRAAWFSFFALAVWTGALVLRNGGQWIWLPLGLAIVLVVLVMAIVLNKRLVTRAYIRVDSEAVERLDAFGGPTLIPRAQIVRMQRCLLRLSGGLGSSTIAYVLLLDAHGKCVMHLHAQVWGKANIDTLQSVLQIPADGSWDDPAGMSYRALRKRFPGSFAWWQANMMWLIAAVLVVGIVGGSVIYVYATGQAG